MAHSFVLTKILTDVVKARNDHTEAQNTVKNAKKELKDEQEALNKDWGSDWEFKKLDGTCLEKSRHDTNFVW